jgi:multidrug efflux pump subunit AcrB
MGWGIRLIDAISASLASGIDLNISVLMGMTMIIGIVTEVAIFYFTVCQ